jgi:hypothetical protein
MLPRSDSMVTAGPILLVLLLVVAVMSPASAAAAEIVIDPGDYTLGFSVAGGEVVTGLVVLDLAPGTYEIDNGARVEIPGSGSSRFVFTVNADGTIGDIRNPVSGAPSGAATAIGNRLVFRQATVQIEPGRYHDDYLLQYRGPELSGTQSVVVVPDLVYQVDEVAYIEADDGERAAFFFFVDGEGVIRGVRRRTGEPSDAASGAGATLYFNK